MKLTVDGYSFNEDQSWYLIDLVLKYTDLDNPEQIQDYLKNHKVEEYQYEIVLRSPDFHKRSFAIRKDWRDKGEANY